MEENFECFKNYVLATNTAISYNNLKVKREVVEHLEEKEASTEYLKKYVMATQAAGLDKSDPGIQETNYFLTAPETFDDVAVAFSEEEWRMLRKEDKELHREVMMQNYETLVSVGYKIPPEKLLLLLKANYDELPKADMEVKNATEQKCHHEYKLISMRNTEWNMSCRLQASLETSHLHHPAENLQQCSQPVKYSDRHYYTQISQHQSGHHCGKITECDKSFTVQQSAITFQKIHTVEKPYKCTECSKCFAHSSHLTNHQAVHTGEKPYKCLECSKHFARKADLLMHQKIHTGDKPYKCTECSNSFVHKSNLLKHQKAHAGEKPYKCTECSKCFVYKSYLVYHEKTHNQEKPYKCAECSKCFSQNSSLIRHQALHTGEKPYKCDECSKSYTEKSGFLYHQKTHTGEKPYKCFECGKCFLHSSHLKCHQAIHMGEKPYKCTECSKCFAHKSNLVKHQKTHTGCRQANNGGPV